MTNKRFRLYLWLRVRRQMGKRALLSKYGAPVARARLLKPGFFANETLAEVPMAGRLLFSGLWTIADREGRLRDSPKWIKAQIFPFDNVKVDGLLNDLMKGGFILRYEGSDGERYIQIVNFGKHQTPHIKEIASTIPAPDEHGASTVQSPSFSGASPSVSKSVPKSVNSSYSGESNPESEAPSGERPTSEPVLSLLTKEPDLLTDFEQLRAHWLKNVAALTTDQSRTLREHYAANPSWVWAAVNETIAAPKPSWVYYLAIMEPCMRDNRPPSSLGKANRTLREEQAPYGESKRASIIPAAAAR